MKRSSLPVRLLLFLLGKGCVIRHAVPPDDPIADWDIAISYSILLVSFYHFDPVVPGTYYNADMLSPTGVVPAGPVSLL